MSAETFDSIGSAARPPRRGLAQLLPFIAKKRLVFTLTVLSGIAAQLANVTALGTGAWLVGQALQGGTPDHLARLDRFLHGESRGRHAPVP